MKKGMKIGIGLILGVMLISIVIPLNARAGSVSNIKVYSEVSGNRFSVNAKWDEDGYIDVEGKLYHNSIIIIESESGCCCHLIMLSQLRFGLDERGECHIAQIIPFIRAHKSTTFFQIQQLLSLLKHCLLLSLAT